MLSFKQLFTTVKADGDLVGLALGPHGRRMGGQVTSGGDQEVCALYRVLCQLILAQRCFDCLDGVKVPILTQKQPADSGQQALRFGADRQVVHYLLRSCTDLLLAVEQRREVGEDGLGFNAGGGFGNACGRHVEETIEIDA